jgi:MoxR-like ATPase
MTPDGTYTGHGSKAYVASKEVADTVNLALLLERPILVEGEPGCGKTMLAYSIAEELGLGKPEKISVKSTSRAQDLLYQVNALARLQDAQTPGNTNARYVYPYLTLGRLGAAIHGKKRSLVLIDEIDKADIDFPNDLLDVLDTFTFNIPELPAGEESLCRDKWGFGTTVEGDPKERPVVVITSNREKRLPEPFLRRCLYIRLKFPATAAELSTIVRLNTGFTDEQLNQKVLTAASEAFLNIRKLAQGQVQKLPSTSEAIDWVKILHWDGVKAEELVEQPYLPPYWDVLFKTMSDLDNYPTVAKAREVKA